MISFLKNPFTKKLEATFAEKRAAFRAELQQLEMKYLSFFHERTLERVSVVPEKLQHHYRLRREFEYIRFDYRPGSDLPHHIRQDCDTAYQKVWGNN